MLTAEQKEQRIRAAQEFDAVVTYIAGCDDRVLWSIADEVRFYAQVRLDRADDPRPLSRMERRYCLEARLNNWIGAMRSSVTMTDSQLDAYVTGMWARAFGVE